MPLLAALMARWPLSALGVAVLLAASGCASPGRMIGGPQPFSDPSAATVRVIVQNRNFSDARLYYARRGARVALGVVGGKSDAEFVIDWDFPDVMQVEIDLLAGPRCVTEELPVDPGDILELQIASVFTDTQNCR
jgi:hypothetical protein